MITEEEMEEVKWRALGVKHNRIKPGEYLYHITNDVDVIDLVFEYDLVKYGLSTSDFEVFKSFEGESTEKNDIENTLKSFTKSVPVPADGGYGELFDFLVKGGVKKMQKEGSSKTEGATSEKKQSNVDYCSELIASGLSKEEVYKAIAKKYTDAGKDEVFATKRAKSIYATTVKTLGA